MKYIRKSEVVSRLKSMRGQTLRVLDDAKERDDRTTVAICHTRLDTLKDVQEQLTFVQEKVVGNGPDAARDVSRIPDKAEWSRRIKIAAEHGKISRSMVASFAHWLLEDLSRPLSELEG